MLKGKRSILLIRGESFLSALSGEIQGLSGFRFETVSGLQEGVGKLGDSRFAAILLDLLLPGGSGFEVLMSLRRNFGLPIFVFSRDVSEADRILAYEMGADDYLSADVSQRELVARLRAVISRALLITGEESDRVRLHFAQDLQIDPGSQSATQSGKALRLTRLEFDLLATLVKRSGQICSRESLLHAVSDEHYNVLERTVDVHIASLRRKLSDDPKAPRYIQTVRGVGYLLLNSSSQCWDSA